MERNIKKHYNYFKDENNKFNRDYENIVINNNFTKDNKEKNTKNKFDDSNIKRNVNNSCDFNKNNI